jgi:hypothetical protein
MLSASLRLDSERKEQAMIRIIRRLHRTGATASRLAKLATTSLLVFALQSQTLPTQAQEQAEALDKPRMAQAPEPYCFCWSDGKKIAEGATACIRTTKGRRLALCGRVINMMSWEVSENPCPES